MTCRAFLPVVTYTAAVLVIAMAAAWIASMPLHSQAVSISTGVTAGWLAGIFLPCPCHPKAGRR